MEGPSQLCEVCAKSFASVSNLNRHMKSHVIVASDSDAFTCRFCDKSFTRSDLKVNHIRSVHGAGLISPNKAKIHACALCAKTFTHRKSVWRHMRCDHPGDAAAATVDGDVDGGDRDEPGYKRTRACCPHCTSSYSTPSNLNKHLRDKHADV